MLNGKNNFQADGAAAECILKLAPEIGDCAWANRGFHQCAARWIAERGVRQFLDTGSGLPTVGNTHEVVQKVDPVCRVVYVDNDPMAHAHAGELLANKTPVRVVPGDVRDPDALLAHRDLRALIDFSQPTGLLLTAVMHFVADKWEPVDLVPHFVSVLAPGSYLALTHLTSDHMPSRSVAGFCRVFEHATEQVHFRTRAEVEALFGGLSLVPPRAQETEGRLCYAGDWAAYDPVLADSDGSRWLYCGVARRD